MIIYTRTAQIFKALLATSLRFYSGLLFTLIKSQLRNAALQLMLSMSYRARRCDDYLDIALPKWFTVQMCGLRSVMESADLCVDLRC